MQETSPSTFSQVTTTRQEQMRNTGFLHNEWKTREQAWQKEFVKYYFKEPVLLLADPCVTLLQLVGTHAWKWGKNLAFGLWKNIWESSSLLALFLKIHHVFPGAVNYIILIDKRMEALRPPKVTPPLRGGAGKSPASPTIQKSFHYQTLLLQPKPDVLDTFLYCSLAIFTSFYFSSKWNCECTSHSISISNGLALLSTTLFPDSFSSLQLAEQRIRINWIRQKKVFFLDALQILPFLSKLRYSAAPCSCPGYTETSLNYVHVSKGIVLKSNLLKCVLSPAQLWTHCWNLDLINSTWVLKWCDTFFRGFFPPISWIRASTTFMETLKGKKIPSNNSPSGNWKHLLKKKEPLGLWMLGIIQSLLPIP